MCTILLGLKVTGVVGGISSTGQIRSATVHCSTTDPPTVDERRRLNGQSDLMSMMMCQIVGDDIQIVALSGQENSRRSAILNGAKFDLLTANNSF